MKVKLISMLFFVQYFLLLTAGCQQKTDREKVISTTRRLISILASGNKTAFVQLNKSSIQQKFKTTKMIENDFEIWKKEFDQAYNTKMGMFVIDNKLNYLGKLKVTVPLRAYKDSLTINGYLFFGPPQFISLDQIAEYEIEVNYKVLPGLKRIN